MQQARNISIALLALTAIGAFAQTAAPQATMDVTILSTVQQQMALAATDIGPMAIGWLSGFLSLQFAFTNIRGLATGGDLTEVWPKVLMFLFTGVMAYYLMNHGPDFLDSVGTGILKRFLSNIPGPGAVILATLGVAGTIVVGIIFIGPVHGALANLLIYILLLVFGGGMYLAAKVFMLYLELGMVVLLSPLSFSFLGLHALRDQGIAPFKALISLTFRAIVLGVSYTAITKVFTVMGTNMTGVEWANPLSWPTIFKSLMAALSGIPILIYMIYKSDSWAAQLASGHTSMGPADIAGAAAAGAAAGAAMGAGAGMATGGTGKAVQTMANFFQSMGSGGGGQVANASNTGTGVALPDAPAASPSASLAEGAPGGSGAMQTTTKGAPISANEGPVSGKSFAPESSRPAAGGSGSGAGIGGATSNRGQAQDPSQRQQLGKNLSELGRHLEKEKNATHISINLGNAD